MNLNYNPWKIKFSSSSSSSLSAPGYQRAATELELHNFVPYFGLLSKKKMDKGCLPFALQSVLETLITKCHLTSWDVHGKGKTTTLVLRWDSDNTAAIARPDQSESVSFARYRKKSTSELRRDAHRAMTRQQQLLAQGQSVKPSNADISSAQVTDTNFALSGSPKLPSQTHPLRSTMTVAKKYRSTDSMTVQTVAKRYRSTESMTVQTVAKRYRSTESMTVQTVAKRYRSTESPDCWQAVPIWTRHYTAAQSSLWCSRCGACSYSACADQPHIHSESLTGDTFS